MQIINHVYSDLKICLHADERLNCIEKAIFVRIPRCAQGLKETKGMECLKERPLSPEVRCLRESAEHRSFSNHYSN